MYHSTKFQSIGRNPDYETKFKTEKQKSTEKFVPYFLWTAEKRPLEVFCIKSCSQKFWNIHWKMTVLE